MHLVYSTALADWALTLFEWEIKIQTVVAEEMYNDLIFLLLLKMQAQFTMNQQVYILLSGQTKQYEFRKDMK